MTAREPPDSPADFLESRRDIARATLSDMDMGALLRLNSSREEGGNAFAGTMQTHGFFENFRFSAKCLILLAPRAGFEPATIRLTVECSTAELPRNRRNLFATGERITKPRSLAKDEIGRSDAASRRAGN